MKKDVKIIECPRDAWQGLPKPIPAAEKAEYGVALVCRCLAVSPAGFYAWHRRRPSDRDQADARLAVEIAACQQLVKGYGETHERGSANFDAILTDAGNRLSQHDAADRVRTLRAAALADDQGIALSKALAAS